jgi:tetratricopeptide (TPR) repeat protein/TolB-like protein
MSEIPTDPILARLARAVTDRYEVERTLGHGGMATVHLARDLKHGRKVAIKVLHPELAAALGGERFLREIDIAARLQHPHILPLLDSGEGEGLLYYVMPFVEGESLRTRLVREGALPPAEARRLLRDIVDGLAAAHRHGVVHRDIKPDNVMIADRHAVVVDFGVAKAVGSALPQQQLTSIGVSLGTPAYMAPEQAAANPQIDHRADIYAVGLIGYEMLAGQALFVGTPQAILAAQILTSPTPLAEVAPHVSPALAAIVMRCLAKEPGERFQSADALLHALEALETTPGDRHAPAPEGSPATPRWSRLTAIAALGAVVLALGIVVVLASRGSNPPLDPQRVLVLPFENRTAEASLDPLGSMAADWIIQGLSQTGFVNVVPLGAVISSARGSTAADDAIEGGGDLQTLAREAGARVVVSGSYYRVGDSLYVQGRITDAGSAEMIAVLPPVSAPAAQPLPALEALRQRVMAGLAPHVDPRMRDHARLVGRTPSYDAYREYAQGLERLYGNADWRAALGHYARAHAIDSSFALPLVGMAVIHAMTNNWPAVDSLGRMLEPRMGDLTELDREQVAMLNGLARGDCVSSHRAAVRAAQLAPNTFGHYQLGTVLLCLNRPHEALRVLQEMDPARGELRGWTMYWIRLTEALHRLGDYRQELAVARRVRERQTDGHAILVSELRALAALGRIDEAMQLLSAHLSTPGDASRGNVLQGIARELHAHGYRDEAQRVFTWSLDWWLARPQGNASSVAEAYYRLGRLDEAERLVRTIAEQFPEGGGWRAGLGAIAARRGDRPEAERRSADLASYERPYLFGTHTVDRARIAALLGDREQAVALLRQAFVEGQRGWLMLHFEPDFESLRGFPPFEELIRPKG